MKKITLPGSLVIIGLLICLAAFLWGINVQERETPRIIFYIGFGFLVAGIFIGTVVYNTDKAFKLLMTGFFVLNFGLYLKSITAPLSTLITFIGIFAFAIGFIWHSYNIIHNDLNL